MATDACLACGHERTTHVPGAGTCVIPGCTCAAYVQTEPVDACITCGHGERSHMILWDTPTTGPCRVTDCTCTKFEPAGNTGPPPVAISFEPDEPDEKIVAAFEAGSKGVTGPPSDPTVEQTTTDLHQAIQAATEALCAQHPAIGLSDPWAQVARIAVETAMPILLQATRDRHADLQARHNELAGTIREWHDECIRLEVHAAELHDLLKQASEYVLRIPAENANALWDQIQAVLQVDGPARGHAILEQVRWANDLLDRYGAPTTIYNPYDRTEQPLNLAGRISKLIDPQNEGFVAVHANLDEVQRLRALLDDQDRCQNCGVTRKGATHRTVSIGVCEITLDQAGKREGDR